MKKSTALSIFLASAAALSGQLAIVDPAQADQEHRRVAFKNGRLTKISMLLRRKTLDAKAAAKKAAEHGYLHPDRRG